jgi:hypothetical protein
MQWDASSQIAELFAQAHRAAGDLASAVRWYETAVEKSGGHASFRTLEEISNIRIRHAFEVVNGLRAEVERLAATPRDGGARPRGAGRTARQQRSDVAKRLRSAIASARTTIKVEMKNLDKLTAFQETAERESLRGSAMKRLAMLEAGERRAAAARQAAKAMAQYYQRALEIADAADADDLFYPATNVMAAELFLNAGKKGKAVDRKLLEKARSSVQKKNKSQPNFWSLVAEPQMRLYEAVSRGNLPTHRPAIERSFRDVSKRSQGSTQWKSVFDTTKFVLEPYMARATPHGRKAAAAVLDLVGSFANKKPSSS